MTRLFSLVAAIIGFTAMPLIASAQDVASLEPVAGVSPVGSWELTTGESRYDVVQCGKGMLCAKLTWLRDDEKTAENLALLDTYVLKGARQTKGGKWEGTVVFEGDTVDGSMTMLDSDTMRITGCRLLCQSFELQRL